MPGEKQDLITLFTRADVAYVMMKKSPARGKLCPYEQFSRWLGDTVLWDQRRRQVIRKRIDLGLDLLQSDMGAKEYADGYEKAQSVFKGMDRECLEETALALLALTVTVPKLNLPYPDPYMVETFDRIFDGKDHSEDALSDDELKRLLDE